MSTQVITMQHSLTGFSPVGSYSQVQSKKHYTHVELENMADEQLIDLTLAGTTSAFGILVQRHQRQMYALALKMVRNHDDAADIAQDVF